MGSLQPAIRALEINEELALGRPLFPPPSSLLCPCHSRAGETRLGTTATGGGAGRGAARTGLRFASMDTALSLATAAIHERTRVCVGVPPPMKSLAAPTPKPEGRPRGRGVEGRALRLHEAHNPQRRARASRGLVPAVNVGIVLCGRGGAAPPPPPHPSAPLGAPAAVTRVRCRDARVHVQGAWREAVARGTAVAEAAGSPAVTASSGTPPPNRWLRRPWRHMPARGRAGGGAVSTAPRRPMIPLPTTRVRGGHRGQRTVAPAPTVRSSFPGDATTSRGLPGERTLRALAVGLAG